MRKLKGNSIQYLIKKILYFPQYFIAHFCDPVDVRIVPKTVLLLGLGEHVKGNLSYVLNELNTGESYKGFQIYVRTTPETDPEVNFLIKQNKWTRSKTVVNDSHYIILLESVEFLLTETYFPDNWVKRPGQTCINIWHGTPLKKIGLAKNTKSCHRNGTPQKNFINADYILFPNQYTREKILSAYKVTSLMQGKSLFLGYPRTGGMLSVGLESSRDIKRKLSVQGEKEIFAFMPTYREILMSVEEETRQIKDFLDYMDKNLNDDQMLYVNLHHKINISINYSAYSKVVPFPADLDSYQLLAITDALITDYSSVMFDYLALRRQIVLYIPDCKLYIKKRGLFMDITELPFDKAFTPEEVLSALKCGKQYDDSSVYDSFCAYDSPDNVKKLCRLFLKDEEDLNLERFPITGKKKLLIHTEWAAAGKITEFLAEFAESCDSSTYEIYFSCNENLKAKESGAYPLFRKFPVIGASGSFYLSETGEKEKGRYLRGKQSLEKAMKSLKKEYSYMNKRIYGEAVFSAILIYDCLDPERILSLSEGETPCMLFLHKDLLDQAESENVFLKDAIRYVAANGVNFLVENETDEERAICLLEGTGCSNPIVCSCRENLDEIVEREMGL